MKCRCGSCLSQFYRLITDTLSVLCATSLDYLHSSAPSYFCFSNECPQRPSFPNVQMPQRRMSFPSTRCFTDAVSAVATSRYNDSSAGRVVEQSLTLIHNPPLTFNRNRYTKEIKRIFLRRRVFFPPRHTSPTLSPQQ